MKQFRWRYLIKPPLQFRFLFFMFVAMLGIVLFIGWNVYFTLGREIFGEISNPHAMDLFRRLNVLLLYRAPIYTAVLVAAAIFFSHKIAGPLYRFEQSADEIGRGRLTHRVRIRKDDEMHELEEKLNAMVESLQRRVTADRSHRDEAMALLAELSSAPGSPDKIQKAREAVAAITRDFEI